MRQSKENNMNTSKTLNNQTNDDDEIENKDRKHLIKRSMTFVYAF